MSTKTQSNWSLRSVVLAPFIWALTRLLSQHTKRLFYFASLYASLIPLEALKSDVMDKLNDAMDLASTADALMFPGFFSRIVWGHHDVERLLDQGTGDIISDQSMETRADELVSLTSSWMCSSWMCFGSMEEMKQETMKFLRFVGQYNATQPALV